MIQPPSTSLWSAGWGGFRLRDQEIFESIQDDKPSRRLRLKIIAGALSALVAGALALALLAEANIRVLWLPILVAAFSFVQHKSITSYLAYLPVVAAAGAVAAFMSGLSLTTGAALVGVGIFLALALEHESRGLALGGWALLFAVASVGWTTVGTIALIVGSLVGAHRAQHLGLWVHRLISRGERRLVDPVMVPLGYVDAARKNLRQEMRRGTTSVSSWHRGSIAERETARLLKGLPKDAVVYHDIPIPGAQVANIDHMVVSRQGIFVVDSKLFAGRVTLNRAGALIKVTNRGEESLAKVDKQMVWACKAVAEEAGGGVQPQAVLAVARARVDDLSTAKDRPAHVHWMSLESLIPFLREQPEAHTDEEVALWRENLSTITREDDSPIRKVMKRLK